jgi:hypothetical protein
VLKVRNISFWSSSAKLIKFGLLSLKKGAKVPEPIRYSKFPEKHR